MSSDSDSSLELHDIESEEDDPFFDYYDPLSSSPQISAVLEDDATGLEGLLDMGRSVNVCDNRGNTPLHLAVLHRRMKVFDYLFTRYDLRVNAKNFEGYTPLMLAMTNCEEHYVYTLVEKGADVDVCNNAGTTPLHLALDNVAVAKKLFFYGADINAQDGNGETPLYAACEKAKCDFIHYMLFCEADVTICNDSKVLPFTASMLSCPDDVQEILFNFTFDRGSKVSLHCLIVAMKVQSPFFCKLIDMCRLVYDEEDLKYLNNNLLLIEPDVFKIFINKYKSVMQHFLTVCNPVTSIFKTSSEKSEPFFYMLMESHCRDHILSIMEAYLMNYISFDAVSEDSLIRILCCVLSWGIGVTTYDMNMIYRFYGFGELFKILLHMKIVDNLCFKKYCLLEEFMLPRLIYDVTMRVNVINQLRPKQLSVKCFENFVKYFAHPRLVEFCRWKNIARNIPDVPSLLQLSRDCVRESLITEYNIKNSMQFHTLLQKLPIYDDLKAILRYETPIYH